MTAFSSNSEIPWKSEGVLLEEALGCIGLPPQNAPIELFHYTSGDGLAGLVASGESWATHAGFFNDTSEWKYGQQLAQHALDRVQARGFKSIAEKVMKKLEANDLFDWYVSCYCTDGDLLPQWRGYGSFGAGYAVGLSGQKLLSDTDGLLLPVVYDEAEQKERMTAIGEWCADRLSDIKPRSDRNKLAPSIIGTMMTALSALILCSKQRIFEHEREWRVVYPWSKDPEAEELPVSFRSVGGVLIPYVKLRIGNPSGSPLPITSVRCGPTLLHESAELAVRMLLDRNGLGNAIVARSGAPLRS